MIALRRIAAVILAIIALITAAHTQYSTYATRYGAPYHTEHFSALTLLVAVAFAWLAVSLWLGRRWWFAN